jgi:hypothetical protein
VAVSSDPIGDERHHEPQFATKGTWPQAKDDEQRRDWPVLPPQGLKLSQPVVNKQEPRWQSHEKGVVACKPHRQIPMKLEALAQYRSACSSCVGRSALRSCNTVAAAADGLPACAPGCSSSPGPASGMEPSDRLGEGNHAHLPIAVGNLCV